MGAKEEPASRMNPSQEDVQRRRSLVKDVHEALKQENFEQVRIIFQDSSSQHNTSLDRAYGEAIAPSEILWQPIRSGWTAMHLAARMVASQSLQLNNSSNHNNTSHDVGWWSWILEHASPSSKFFTARDKSGETCFDIFFNTWLATSPPIQSGSAPPPAQRRRQQSPQDSMELVLACPLLAASLQHCITMSTMDAETYRFPNLHVEHVARFWRALEFLCRAAVTNKFLANRSDCSDDHEVVRKMSGNTTASATEFSMLHVLCRLNTCPAIVGRLVMAMDITKVYQHPLPLHVWTHYSQ
jgi:hypothetical protein